MSTEPPISIALSSNQRYVPGLLVTSTSLLLHTSADQPIEFLVLDCGISERSWRTFEATVRRFSKRVSTVRLRPDLSVFARCPTLNGNRSAYATLLLPRLVNRTRLITIDVDILVLRDVRELWSLDFKGQTALAVYHQDVVLGQDCAWLSPDDPARQLPYFNSGVIVLNLERWRKLELDHQVDQALSRFGDQMVTHDQTILNYVLREESGTLDPSWNLFDVGGVNPDRYTQDEGVLVHITHAKPWLQLKNLYGSSLWIMFHDLFVSRTPALVRYGVLFRTRKWTNFRAALRAVMEGFLLQTGPTRSLLLRTLEKDPAQRFKSHWLRRWIERKALDTALRESSSGQRN